MENQNTTQSLDEMINMLDKKIEEVSEEMKDWTKDDYDKSNFFSNKMPPVTTVGLIFVLKI